MLLCGVRCLFVLVAVCVTFSGCARSEQAAQSQASTVIAPTGYHVEPLVRDLQAPTQMILGPDGRLWVAQLAGGENAGQGQVVAVSLSSGEREVLVRGLYKPTGIAMLDGSLWIVAGRDVLRAPVNGSKVGTPVVVLKDLPFNGRSNGTLTVSPESRLLYETSGSRSGSRAGEGSGMLWELDPAKPTNPRPLAAGLKGAYAHTFDLKGRLWTTEIGDDPVDNGSPPDELNLVVAGGDYGWPRCFAAQQPVRLYSGDEGACRTTQSPAALFPPHSTPTSVASSPWEPDTLLVALWNTNPGRVERVVVDANGRASETTVFLSGLEHPQHMLALDDGTLLVSDFGTGVVYRVSRVASDASRAEELTG